MARVAVQSEPFDVARELAALTQGRTDVGGIGCFIGIVRDDAAQTLASLTLEHYPGMTERSLAAIATTAEARWSLLGCTVIHRTGRLIPADPIVLVLTSAPHREAALASTAFLIDWLKTKAPFWKSEQTNDGHSRWVDARPEDDAAAEKWRES